MAKRLKLKLAKVIPSFQSCRSKETSALPSTNHVHSSLRLSPVNANPINVHFAPDTPKLPPHPPPPPPRSKPLRHSLRHHVSSAFTSVGCGFRSRATLSDDDRSESPDFHWEKEDKWHVVAQVQNEPVDDGRRRNCRSSISRESDFDKDDDVLASPPPPPPPSSAEKKKRRSKKKKTTYRFRMSTSSAESGLFSSESVEELDDEETETLVSSSRSFSTDSSSEFNLNLETIREKPSRARRTKKKKKRKDKKSANRVKKLKRCVSRVNASTLSPPENESPARLSVFQRLIPCRVEGKVRESFAVVKKSEDPYEDFKKSMMEMIMEKEMFDEKDLEQLLHCFLSLNDKQHHGIIVEAFSEIWEALFCRRSTSTGRRTSSDQAL